MLSYGNPAREKERYTFFHPVIDGVAAQFLHHPCHGLLFFGHFVQAVSYPEIITLFHGVVLFNDPRRAAEYSLSLGGAAETVVGVCDLAVGVESVKGVYYAELCGETLLIEDACAIG